MSVSKEKFRIYNNVFDEFTNKNIFKLQSQGYFDQLTTALSLGKEANIFLGKKQDGSYVIVKIYRVQNCNFNKMYGYIKSDPRYQDLRGRRRDVIMEWVRREYRNLHIARDAGVRVPTPYAFNNNIIVMELIGTKEEIALQIKDCTIEDPEKFVDQIIEQMRLLYHKAEIIHADLSMFNILYLKGKPVIIDMSQSTSIKDVNANEYLERDIENIVSFATRNGVEMDAAKVKKRILAK